MKNVIIRKIDELGRVVIPKDYLLELDLGVGADVSITVEDESIIITKARGDINE